MHLDAHQRPPSSLKVLFKQYQRADASALTEDEAVVDFGIGLRETQSTMFEMIPWKRSENFQEVCHHFLYGSGPASTEDFPTRQIAGFAYHSLDIPGLFIIPAMLPINVQQVTLARIFHRDLSNALHKTNLDMHYNVQHPETGHSFFGYDPHSRDIVIPKDPELHRHLSVGQFLTKKLRWITLGGQYDWTQKVYPDEEPPPFPEDLKTLLVGLFPETQAEAAIVNLYSPGDTLSLHRDVSEECDRGLISVSIGCDCVFVLGLEDESASGKTRRLVMRLRSGDVVYMAGASRFAWHGVPLIIPNTCPEQLQSWPANRPLEAAPSIEQDFERWAGWMSSKRINLNVRQMRE